MVVYAPNFHHKRLLQLEELAGLGRWRDVLWVIGGDFNATHLPSRDGRC